MSALTLSHAVIATNDVSRITRFMAEIFGLKPHYETPEFSEFVFGTGFRLAFFLPVGKSKDNFSSDGNRASQSLGITVRDVDAVFALFSHWCDKNLITAPLPPKDHPWGERSFLIIDPDGNRWEVTRSPSENGMLKEIPKK